MSKQLTNRQQQVLDFIVGQIRQRSIPPTLREICEHFGLHPPSGAAEHLRALKNKGCLDWDPGRSRSIRVLYKADGIPIIDLAQVDRP